MWPQLKMHSLDEMKAIVGRAFLLTLGVSGEAGHMEKEDQRACVHH